MKTFKQFIKEDDIDSYESRMTAGLGGFTPYGGGRFGGGYAKRSGSGADLTRVKASDINTRTGEKIFKVDDKTKLTTDKKSESLPVKDVIDKNKTFGTKEGNIGDIVKPPTPKLAYGWLNDKGSFIKNRNNDIHADTYSRFTGQGKDIGANRGEASYKKIDQAIEKGWARIYIKKQGDETFGVVQRNASKWTPRHEKALALVRKAMKTNKTKDETEFDDQ